MAKKKSENLNKWLVGGLIISVALNLIVAAIIFYATVVTGPLALNAGTYFFAEALENDPVEVDGKTYNCLRRDVSTLGEEKGEKLCYGAVYIDKNNQEVK